MEGLLFAFRSRDPSRTATSRLAKKLYGQPTSSDGHSNRRKGLLDGIPKRRLTRGVFLVPVEEGPPARRLLQESGWDVHVRRVILTPGDERAFKA